MVVSAIERFGDPGVQFLAECGCHQINPFFFPRAAFDFELKITPIEFG
jgi:hypothetical protein